MARYERQDSHVVFQPSPLSLTTNKHRASLDGNETSLLTGIDPRTYGAYGRMPGGRHIPAATITGTKPDKEAHRSFFFNSRGLRNGHIPISKVVSATTSLATLDLTVDSTFGFEDGDFVVVFDTTAFQSHMVGIGRIDRPGGVNRATKTICITMATALTDTSVGSNTYVVRCCPQCTQGAMPDARSGLTTVSNVVDLQIGDKVYVIAHNEESATDVPQEYQLVAYNPSTQLLTWSPGAPRTITTATRLVTIIPKIPFMSMDQPSIYLTYEDARIWQVKGSSSANTTWSEVVNTSISNSPWSMAGVDRQIFCTNANSEPFKITTASQLYDPTVAIESPRHGHSYPEVSQEDPVEPIGFAEESENVTNRFDKDGSAGNMTDGVHSIFYRLLDRSTNPPTKSPPLYKTSTASLSSEGIEFNAERAGQDLWEGDSLFHRANRKATHYEFWMSPVHTLRTTAASEFYLVETGHLSRLLLDNGSGFNDAYFLPGMTDVELQTKIRLDEVNDMEKGLMPNGKFIHSADEITYVAGATGSDHTDTDYPQLVSGNEVRFSRTDVSEPENFPAGNYRTLGQVGDEVMGFVSAGDVTVVLGRFSYTTAQRAATSIVWRDGDMYGAGCAYEEAYTSLGTHAAWVSDERIWLFNGRTLESPKDIGFPIRDWVKGLRDNKEVRMGYDPSSYMLWVGTRKQDDTCECRVYSFEEDTWSAMDDVWLAAPITGFGMWNDTTTFQDSSRLYRFPGSPPTMHNVVDYYDYPTVQGGHSPSSFTLSGTGLSASGGITTITGLTLPAVTTEKALVGNHIRFIQSNGTESVRIISAATATAITWVSSYTGNADNNDSWIIGGIPFRLRYPIIRGQDIFTKKVVRGAQFLVDDIRLDGQAGPFNMTVNLLRNFASTTPTGVTQATGTISLVESDAVAALDKSLAVDVSATGKTVELEVLQVDSHVGFSLVYGACRVSIPGPVSEDRSSTV